MIIDLERKTVWSDNGEVLVKRGIIFDETLNAIQPISVDFLDTLYQNYKHSVPDTGAKTQQNSRYFRALDITELSDRDLKNNISRRKAAEALELAVVIAYSRGDISFDRTKWYWQSQQDPDFIILRKWVI